MKNSIPTFSKSIVIFALCFTLASQITAAQTPPVHFWYFSNELPNNTPFEELDAFYSITEEHAFIEYHSALEGYPFDSEHPSWRKASMERRNNPTEMNYRTLANEGLPYDVEEMRGLQIKQPFTGDGGENTMIFHLPTTGYENIVFMFAAVDEGAANELIIDYSIDEQTPTWITDGLAATTFNLSENYNLFTIDFSGNGMDLESVNNNPHFKIRIRFGGDNMQEDLENRVTFNNISLDGSPLDDTNLPPVIVDPLALQKLVHNGEDLAINLDDVFQDPDNDELTFSVSSDHPDFVQAEINDNILLLSAVARGDAHITVTANDGFHDDVSHSFRAFVYPEAHDISQSDFSFTQWNNNHPDYAYPDNMMFLQTDFGDPGAADPLLFPYFIPHDDYNEDDHGTIGYPYNNTRRTRINGLGIGGVSFINTGRDRDLGGAMVAINTQGQTGLFIDFLAGTILENEREYAFRLQYRTGTEGPFLDVYHNNQPVEYVVSETGDMVNFENIEMPQELLGQEYVQLLWRYYHVDGETGPRAQLRLDDIHIKTTLSAQEAVAEHHYKVYADQENLFVENHREDQVKVTIISLTGQQIKSTVLSGQGRHSISTKVNPGFYIINLKGNHHNEVQKIFIP